MPTSKKRINVSLPDDLFAALQILAERDDMPTATKALYLLRIAMEIEEDEVLNTIASERDTKGATFLSHKQVWE